MCPKTEIHTYLQLYTHTLVSHLYTPNKLVTGQVSASLSIEESMSYLKRPDYDDIHGFVERVEDVLLSESSWSTSDSDCSGCLHLSKESVNIEEPAPTLAAALTDISSEQTPL